MKSRVYHTSSGKCGTVIRDNDQPLVRWDDGTETIEQWSSLTTAVGRHELWTITGGPNDGLKIQFKPDGHETQARIGADRYTVRHHDRILLFRGYDPATDDAAWNKRIQEELQRLDFDND